MSEFIVNDYISLKLENRITNIYIKNEKFIQCKYLLLHITEVETEFYKKINSIDEVAERLNHSLESISNEENKIEPEVEFWGHCSNLQSWIENDYNTLILHSNIAFPLLKKLTEVGAPKAKVAFEEEIVKRILSGYFPTIAFLFSEGYINYLSKQALEYILESPITAFENSDEVLYWVVKSMLYHEIGKKSEADKSFERALTFEINQEYKYGLNEFGTAFHKKKEFLKAIELFKLALKIDQNYKFAWNNLSEVYKDSHEYKKAIYACIKATDIDPEFEDAWFNLGILYNQNEQYSKALKAYNHVLEINPDNFLAWGEIGTVYGELGENWKSIESYKHSLEIEPNIEFYLQNLAGAYIEVKDFDNALKSCERILEIDPEFPGAWENLGYVYRQKGYSKKEIKIRKKDFKKDLKLKRKWYDLGLTYYENKEFDKATNAFKEAIKIDPEFKNAWDMLKSTFGKIDEPNSHPKYDLYWSYDKYLKNNELKNNPRDSIDFIEEKLRQFIKQLLLDYYKEDWWQIGIPFKIRENVESLIIKKKKKYPDRHFRKINLLFFSNYNDIICYTKNWKNLFQNFFNRKYNVNYLFENLNNIRNDLFHGNFFQQDFLKLKLFIEDVVKFIEKPF